jgi:dTDP-4-dehydrorhamnose reductase
MSKNIVVLGVSGMLGHKMLQVLSNKFTVTGTLRKFNTSQLLEPYELYEGVDVNNFLNVMESLNKIDPDVIVNCIGIIKQLPESNDWDKSFSINSEFPHKLSIYAKAHGMQLIHISTDCVFDGKIGLYREVDIPNAIDIYGRTKFVGEVSDINCLTLRTSIIGREINTRHGLLEWFLSKKGMKIQGYTKSIFSGVTTNELASLVSDIIQNGRGLQGLYHVAAEPISKFNLLTKINSHLLDNKVEIESVDGEIINRSLNGLKLKRTLGYSPPSWDDMLYKMMVKDTTDYGVIE